MQRSTRTICFALGLAAALGFSGLANANATSDEVRRAEVSFSDLDLSRTAGANTLYTRIQRAARNVCEVNTVPNPQALLLERKCMAKAMDDAVRSVDDPNLTAVYMRKVGKRALVASNR